MRRRPRWRTVLRVFGLLLLLGLAAAMLFWWLRGDDLLYDAIFPRDAARLEGEELPTALGPEDWSADLDALARDLPRLHVDFDDAYAGGRFSLRLNEARELAATGSRTEMEMAILAVVAAGGTGTGHDGVVPLQRPLRWRFYPLSYWEFEDGLFVTLARDRTLEGARVERIGGRRPREVLKRLERYVTGDNPGHRRYRSASLLVFAEPLVALGLAEADGGLPLEISGPDGAPARRVVLEPVRLASLGGLLWARRSQSAVATWSPADPRPRSEPIALVPGPDPGTLVLRYHAVRDREAIESVAQRLARPEQGSIRRLVVDLRANEGGNNELNEPLVRALAGHPVFDRPGGLFVLLSRRTFSAAANFALALERRTAAVFVGEPSGFAPIHFGDTELLMLPRSRILVRFATRRWQEDPPGVRRPALEPDLPVPFRASDHFEDRDPVWAALDAYTPPARPTPETSGTPPAGTWLLTPLHRVSVDTASDPPLLTIDSVGPYARTRLHLEAPGRFGTEIRDVELRLDGDAPRLRWKGTDFALEAVPSSYRLPIERIEAGDVAGGAAAYRAARQAGAAIGSDHELALNRVGYERLRSGRVDEAVSILELAADLFPSSPNVYDSLGEALGAAGRTEDAVAAYREALAIDPDWEHPRRAIEELTGDRK